MPLTPASKQRLLVFSVLLCGVTAQDRPEGSTSAGAAAFKQQHHADSDAVAELIDWIVAAGGEARPSQPCCLAYMVLQPASGRPASNRGFLSAEAGRSCRCVQACYTCQAACAVCRRPRTLPRGSWCSRFQRHWPCLLATTCCTVRCAATPCACWACFTVFHILRGLHPPAEGANVSVSVGACCGFSSRVCLESGFK